MPWQLLACFCIRTGWMVQNINTNHRWGHERPIQMQQRIMEMHRPTKSFDGVKIVGRLLRCDIPTVGMIVCGNTNASSCC